MPRAAPRRPATPSPQRLRDLLRKQEARRGLLLAFEGPEGGGKTTQRKLFKTWLESEGHDVVTSRWSSSKLVKPLIKARKKLRALGPEEFCLLHAADWLANAFNGLGNIYHLERDFDQAILYYSEAIKLRWGFAVAWMNRGDAYMSKGEIKEAMWDFNVACQLGYEPACKELHALER